MPIRCSVASTNFLASATLVARQAARCAAHRHGLDDDRHHCHRRRQAARRAASPTASGWRPGELVYTGLTRTDVSVVTHSGRRSADASSGSPPAASPTWPTCAASSATLADGVDQHGTARRPRQVGGGERRALRPLLRPRCRRCAGRRLARRGAARSPTSRWPRCAPPSRRFWPPRRCRQSAPIVAAGIGAPQIETLMQGARARDRCGFGTLANAAPDCADWATRCAPAVAVALLANDV